MSITKEKFRTYIELPDETKDRTSLESTYYLELFEEYYKNNQDMKLFIKWNWFAFLLGPIWMTYRGMFWAAALLFVITQGFTYLDISLYLMGILVLWVLNGLYGNALYLMHVMYWIKEDNQAKKGVDRSMSFIILILCVFQFFSKIYTS